MKDEHQGYCWPSLGEPCGQCHRCGNPAPEQELAGDYCSECKIQGDHTWWCSIAPEVLPNGKRPYYWRD